MKLSKLSENCPSWMDDCVMSIVAKHSATCPSAEDIDKTVKAQVEDEPMTEDQICAECSRIEQCASSGETYTYKPTLNKADIAHLKEYTLACGMKLDKFVVATEETKKVVEAKVEPQIVKTASAEPSASTEPKKELTLAEKLSAVMKDPFHIDERSDDSKTKPSKADWEKVTLAQKMPDQPIMSAGIIPLRGGEDYFKNSETSRTAPGQNSIDNPDAIGKLAQSKTEDTGARLKREKVEKEAAIKATHQTWQKEKVDAMPQLNIVPKGNVFPTETLTAQTGLNRPSSQMGVYAKFDPASIPEKTEGEMIVQANKDRKQAIQREKPEDKWESPRSQSARSVSDVFGESLEKFLKGK